MRKLVKLAALVIVLSGWAAFGILYVFSSNEKARADMRITELESELESYQFLMEDVEESAGRINSIIGTLETLKGNLETLKGKMDKGEK